MSVGIIELNDSGIRFDLEGEERIESPGVAVIRGNELLLGDDAVHLARLHPVETNNIFWHRLSVEPLKINHPQFRHHADLAYHQLMTIHQKFDQCSDIIFAIPGSFTRDQLSLLLGIVQQCPFNAVGLVDSAVAASSGFDGNGQTVHIDLQLHQCLLTGLEVSDKISRSTVHAISSSGMLAIHSKLAQYLADEFVAQSRFDPLHSANTEQFLYDQIPNWLRLSNQQDELILEVGGKNIKLSREQFMEPLLPIYQRIAQQAQQIFPSASQFLLSDRFAILPGFSNQIKSSTLLPNNAVISGIQQFLQDIRNDNDDVSFVQSLPKTSRSASKTQSSSTTTPETEIGSSTNTIQQTLTAKHASVASHVLLNSTAIPLSTAPLYVNGEHALSIQTQPQPASRCSLQRQDEKILLTPLSGVIRINQHPIYDNVVVKAGDLIQFDSVTDAITLINVLNGH